MHTRRSAIAISAAGVAATWAGTAAAQAQTTGSIERLEPELDGLIAPGTSVEKAVGGFRFLEAPMWRRSGVLWLSDLVGNIVYEWKPGDKPVEVLNPGGYDGHDMPDGSYQGPNGMAPGPKNTVTLCQHGNRRIVSLDRNKKLTVLVDRFEGKRLNSPNDLAYAPDGSFYFTDPPYGLVKGDNDPAKELPFNGVYRYDKGKLQLLIQDIPTPNGIALSPDYKTLYVTDAKGPQRRWRRYDVGADGGVSNGRVFVDASASKEPGTTDGLELDSAGNLYATGPGGIWVMTPQGKHLGTIKLPESPTSAAFGGRDGKTLYITARTSIYSVQVKIAGLKPPNF